ncbi:MAG: hypothetical protein HFG08_02030 [Oscillibacter sp.]|nr:hypothetical protein [Oscillibacter sp.]
MYNRYIRNDNGSYSRIPEEEHSPPSGGTAPPPPPPPPPPGPENPPPKPGNPGGNPGNPGRTGDGLTGILQHILDQFHLDHVDTGDMLLLAMLFFLFRENADEELLVALGLLLIL